jgi:hypothetical protein
MKGVESFGSDDKDDVKSSVVKASNKMSFDLRKPKSAEESFSLGAMYTREHRATLTADGKAKFTKLATEALEPQFKITDYTKFDNSKLLEKNMDFTVHIERLRRKLMMFGMLDVFQVPDDIMSCDVYEGPNLNETVDLLRNYQSFDLNTIQQWTNFVFTYMDDISIENCHLSEIMLLNSCEGELYTKINNELSTMPTNTRGGPVVLYLITRHVIALTEKTTRAFIQQLQKLKVSQFPNEDVSEFVAVFKNAANRLQASNKLPPDIRELAYEGLRNCTVWDYKQHLTILWTMDSKNVTTWESLLETANTLFQDLILQSRWLTTKKKGSSFTANTNTTKANNSTASSNNNNNPNAGNKSFPPRPVDRTPPKEGESTTRTRADGKGEEHWCSKCKGGGRWGNHLNDGHDKFIADHQERLKKKNLKKKEKKANNTTTTTTTNDAPPTELNEEAQTRLRPVGRANFSQHF